MRKFRTFLVKPEIAAITSFLIAIGLILMLMMKSLLITSPAYFDFVSSVVKNQFISLLILSIPSLLKLILTLWLLLTLEVISRKPELEQGLNDLFSKKQLGPGINSFLLVYSPLEYIRRVLQIKITKFWSCEGGLIVGLVLSFILTHYIKPSISTLSDTQLRAQKLAETKFGPNYHYFVYYVSKNKKYAKAYAYNDKKVEKIEINLN